MTSLPDSEQLADLIYESESAIARMQEHQQYLKNQLAAALLASEKKEVVGNYGQRYKLSKSRASYVYNLPLEEFQRLNIVQACTKPALPKMTKTLSEQLAKEGMIKLSDLAKWEQEGWYQKQGGDEYTIIQAKSTLEDIAPG